MAEVKAFTLYQAGGQEIKVELKKKRRSPKKRDVSPQQKPLPYPPEVLDEAKVVAGKVDLLESKLADQSFREACLYCGLKPEYLRPKDKQEFERLPNRVQILPEETIRKRWEAFEKTRLGNIAMVLHKQVETEEYVKESKAEEARRNDILKEVFKEKMDKEERRKAKMERNRQKYVLALKLENERLVQIRSKAANQSNVRSHRHSNLAIRRAGDKSNYAYQQKCRQAKIMKQVEAVRRAKREKGLKTMMEIDAKNRQLEAMHEEANTNAQARGMAIREENERLEREKQALANKMRLKMTQDIQARARKVQAVQATRAAMIENQKVARKLKIEGRAEHARQVRSANEYARQRVVEKMKATNRRIEDIRQMKSALTKERKKNQRLEWILQDKWKQTRVLERAVTPGPADYELPSTLHATGGTWGKYRAPSQIERIIMRAGDTPGPGQYPQKSTLNGAGGSWSFYSPKSDIEWAEERARAQPGPGEYNVAPKAYGHGMGFSEANPRTAMQIEVDSKRYLPGPGLYGNPMPKSNPPLKDLIKKFSTTMTAIKFGSKLKRLQRERIEARDKDDAGRNTNKVGSGEASASRAEELVAEEES